VEVGCLLLYNDCRIQSGDEGVRSVTTIEDVKAILDQTLQLGGRARSFDAATGLFGSIPEFDSMAVVTVVTALEERFGIAVADDEISAEIFETVGSLSHFVDRKLTS
jgi:acyl carrier protein